MDLMKIVENGINDINNGGTGEQAFLVLIKAAKQQKPNSDLSSSYANANTFGMVNSSLVNNTNSHLANI
jgi:hypothetical protein